VRQAVSLVERGFLSRAAATLLQEELPVVNEAVLEQLRTLHPPASAPLPPLPDNTPTLVAVDGELLEQIILKQLANGSGPGPSGWTGELVRELVSSTECVEALGVLVRDIINGVLDVHSTRLLLAARLIPAPKRTGGVRPVAIMEVFVRLASLYIAHQLENTSMLFPSIQLGVGHEGGPERAVHIIQAAIERAGPSGTICSTDFTNAFNTRSRAVIAHALHEARHQHPRVEKAFRFYHWAYGTASPLLVYGPDGGLRECLSSAEGVRQGDPLSAFFFALSIQRVYEAVVKAAPGVVAVAIQDDFTLVGQATETLAGFDALVAESAASSLPLNASKCAILHPNSEPPAALAEQCAGRGITLAAGPALPLLGTLVGRLGESVVAWCGTYAQEHRQLFQALQHPEMPLQVAYLLLRVCGVPRMGYLTRTTPPSLSTTGLQAFDTMVLTTLCKKLDLPAPLPDAAQQQLSLPIRDGGLGVRPHARVAEAAFLSSLCQAVQDLHPTAPAFARDTCPRFAEFASCHQALLDSGVSIQLVQETPEALWDAAKDGVPEDHMQKALTAALEYRLLEQLANHFTRADTARMLSVANKHAHLWLTTTPSCEDFQLSDGQFALAVRHLLGLPPADTLPDKCACGELLLSADHFHCCRRTRKTSCNSRHNLILHVLSRLAAEAGGTMELEPRIGGGKRGQRRTDGYYIGVKTITHIDVGIVHPSAPSHLAGASQWQLHAAGTYEKAKQREYEEAAKAENAAFAPFVMESFGAVGHRSLPLLNMLGEEAAVHGHEGETQFVARALRVLSFELQRANAHIAASGCVMARRAIRRVGLLAGGGLHQDNDLDNDSTGSGEDE
jgi:hypothetical protein